MEALMGIRDEELKRLTRYAEGLNIKVHFKPYVRGQGGAEWDMKTREIFIYVSPRDSKTKTILSLLHELGHHLDWIYTNKQISSEVEKAFVMLNNGPIEGERLDIPKKYRKIIYEEEKAGIQFMSQIAKECDLGIPKWKIKLQEYLDLIEYEYLYKKGRFLTNKEHYDLKIKAKERFKKEYK